MYHQHNLCLLTLTLTTWLRPSLSGFSTVKWGFLLFPYPTLQKEVGLRHVLKPENASCHRVVCPQPLFTPPTSGQSRTPSKPHLRLWAQKPQSLAPLLAWGLSSHLGLATTRPHVYQGPIDPRLIGLHYPRQGKGSLNPRGVLAMHLQQTLTIHYHVFFFPHPTYSFEGGWSLPGASAPPPWG